MLSTDVLQLPPLREDLQLLPAPNANDGSPAWTLYDPMRNHFYRIGVLVFRMLNHWTTGNSQALIEKISNTTTLQPTQDDVNKLVGFLHANRLTIPSLSEASENYLAQHQKAKKSWWSSLLHHYLFFRLPLVRPDSFLQRTYPVIKKLYVSAFVLFILLIGMVGLYFVSRQWDVFTATFLHFFTAQGAAIYAIALVGTKIIHELGHAYTAKRYGCRIPSMGVAFLVMMPMLYTDMSDTWRLTSRKQRLHIGAAGVINELMLACVCTFLWNFLPDGIFRSVCFVTATTSWISTLAINLMPFLRFDGYYLLSDWWGIDNLQQRSFQLARWKLRELVFGLPESKPEHFLPHLERKLIFYAWFTWIYRLILFTGIALLVYHFFFKLLGVFLFIVEIVWFIWMPIVKELAQWWQLKSEITQSRRVWLWAALLLGLIGLFLIPWNSHIRAQGILTAATHATLYSPEPGQIVSIPVKRGQRVEQGQVLLVLKSPVLDEDISRTHKKLEFFNLRARRAVTNRQDQDDLRVVLQQIASESSRLAGLEEKRKKLVLRAPFNGVVAEMDDGLKVGQWISNTMPICFVMDHATAEIKGLIPESELSRIEVGQTAVFYPEDPTIAAVDTTVSRIDWGNIKVFDLPYLASQYGGEIVVKQHQNGALVPLASVYAIRLNNISQTVPKREIRGSIHIQGKPRSFAKRAYEFAASVLIRESGF